MDLRKWSKCFVVASLSRLDLQEKGFPIEVIEALTDADMQTIADKMGDLYCDNGYWEDVEFVTDTLLAEKQSGGTPS